LASLAIVIIQLFILILVSYMVFADARYASETREQELAYHDGDD
jgi:hypothetical protein